MKFEITKARMMQNNFRETQSFSFTGLEGTILQKHTINDKIFRCDLTSLVTIRH